jgi:adenylate kinase
LALFNRSLNQNHFGRRPTVMKTVVCTGITGTNVGKYLEKANRIANLKLEVFDVGCEIRKIAEERGQVIDEEVILNRPEPMLAALRSAAFERLGSRLSDIRGQGQADWLVVDVHALFPWKSGFVTGFDPNYLRELRPDLFVTLVDALPNLLQSLWAKPGWRWIDATTVLAWRQLEVVLTQLMASLGPDKRTPHYLLGTGGTEQVFLKLLSAPQEKKIYFSYPITYADEEQQRQAEAFARTLGKDFIVFEPKTVGELDIAFELGKRKPTLSKKPRSWSSRNVTDVVESLILEGSRREALLHHLYQQIREQTVWLDYKLIDQSDAVVVYYPSVQLEVVNEKGKSVTGFHLRRKGATTEHSDTYSPLSAGVLSETIHAFTNEKDVYLIWLGKGAPSNFLDFHCSDWFTTPQDCLNYLRREYRVSRAAA